MIVSPVGGWLGVEENCVCFFRPSDFSLDDMGIICSRHIKDEHDDRKQHKKNKRIYLCDSDGECQSSMCMRGMPEDRPVLSKETKERVVQSWEVIKRDIEKVGVVFFMGLLEEDEIKNTFRAFRSTSKDDLRQSAALRSHVLRVMGAVDKLVARLETPSKMIFLLHELGQSHIEFNTRPEYLDMVFLLHELGHSHIEFSARPEYLDLVGPQFIRAIQPALGEGFTPEVEQAWADMFRYITHVMKETMVM